MDRVSFSLIQQGGVEEGRGLNRLDCVVPSADIRVVEDELAVLLVTLDLPFFVRPNRLREVVGLLVVAVIDRGVPADRVVFMRPEELRSESYGFDRGVEFQVREHLPEMRYRVEGEFVKVDSHNWFVCLLNEPEPYSDVASKPVDPVSVEPVLREWQGMWCVAVDFSVPDSVVADLAEYVRPRVLPHEEIDVRLAELLVVGRCFIRRYESTGVIREVSDDRRPPRRHRVRSELVDKVGCDDGALSVVTAGHASDLHLWAVSDPVGFTESVDPGDRIEHVGNHGGTAIGHPENSDHGNGGFVCRWRHKSLRSRLRHFTVFDPLSKTEVSDVSAPEV